MKYMGSKRRMLQNGLGKILTAELSGHHRLVDLFCGSGSVSWFAATTSTAPVLSVDLQSYATCLARAVIGRTRAIDSHQLGKRWLDDALAWAESHRLWKQARETDLAGTNTVTWSKRARGIAEAFATEDTLVVSRCYAGHYFSPTQAMLFDGMIASLPRKGDLRDVCLAATIMAASKCVASPGHTAQPFSPKGRSGIFLREAWHRSPVDLARRAVEQICPLHAAVSGAAITADALSVAKTLRKGDLVFLDPPYSGVHYSRFYHVLETIARGRSGAVDGVGRYPPANERPVSSFSRKTESKDALAELLSCLARRGCSVIITFPAAQCSNGLSGSEVERTAKEWFGVRNKAIKARFSTLGGNNEHRAARQDSDELVLVLKPKKMGRRI